MSTGKIHIGDANFNVDDLASQGNAILGIRDSGKSYTATYLAERIMDAGVPIVAFDPIGIWKSLRVGVKGKGYPVVVAGGRDGDLPLTPEGAPEIMRAALRGHVSIVFDLFSHDLSKADWRRIVERVVRVLLYENDQHGLRHVFIEEAAEFIPQVIRDQQGAVYAELEKLARMGGNSLLGYTLINQRAEEVNKAVLELCDCLFLHRQKGRNSLTALSKWLDVADAGNSKAIISSLSTLPQGECWVWQQGTRQPTRITVPAKNTFHPDRRRMRSVPTGADKKVDVNLFVKEMSVSLEQIVKEAEENDPKVLKRRIRELERQVQTQIDQFIAGDEAEVQRRVKEALGAQQEQMRNFLGPHISELSRWLNDNQAEIVVHTPRLPLPAKTNSTPTVRMDQKSAATRAALDRMPMNNSPLRGGALGRAERKILTALAQYKGEKLSKKRIAVLAVYAVGGGGFLNALGALRTKGYVEGRDELQITAEGLKALGRFDPLPAGDDLLQYWYGQLGKAEKLALEVLANTYPKALTKEQIAAKAGYEAKGGGFLNALGRLRTLELIEGRSEIKASDNLFG